MGFGPTFFSDFDGVLVIFEVNDTVFWGLKLGDMAFGVYVIIKTFMDIEMIWLDAENGGDVGGFFEVPELEAGHLVDDDRFWLEAVEGT